MALRRWIDSLESLRCVLLLIHPNDSFVEVCFRVCSLEFVINDNPYAFFARFFFLAFFKAIASAKGRDFLDFFPLFIGIPMAFITARFWRLSREASMRSPGLLNFILESREDCRARTAVGEPA